MKLFILPGACSIGMHVLLEEIGKPYEVEEVDRNVPVPDRALTRVNPKSKVPTLVRDDGSVLTEYPIVAYWLARSNAELGLLPPDLEAETRALEAMDHVVSTMHMQGFTRQFRPQNFTFSESEYDAVRARGREIADKSFEMMDHLLAGRDYLAGDFSVADTALFYVEFWQTNRLKAALPPNCAAHYARMLARPAVGRVLEAEGMA